MRRRVSFPLVPMADTSLGDNTAELDYSNIVFPSIMIFPKPCYPLEDVNQVELYWALNSFPAGATFVDVTPISFRAFLLDPSNLAAAAGYQIGTISADALTFEWFEFQFDQLDNTNNRVTTHPYKIRKTTFDPALTVNGQSYLRGTRHSLPLADPYMGFLVQSDGTSPGGIQAFHGVLTWA